MGSMGSKTQVESTGVSLERSTLCMKETVYPTWSATLLHAQWDLHLKKRRKYLLLATEIKIHKTHSCSESPQCAGDPSGRH